MLCCIVSIFFVDVGVNDVVVDEWCEEVYEEDGEYLVFWECWVDVVDDDFEYIDEKVVDVVFGVGLSGIYWVGCYEDGVEGLVIEYDVLVLGNV